jgi:enoyl-[acyl-carrier protein] reductase II
MIRSPFSLKCVEYEKRGATPEECKVLLGQKRERMGIFEGNWEEGQFEAGMGSGMIHDIPSASELVERLVSEYQTATEKLCDKK